MHFLEWKCMNFDYDFTEGSNSQYSSIGADKAISHYLNHDDYRRIYASLGFNALKDQQLSNGKFQLSC